jgi:hypothetical protein
MAAAVIAAIDQHAVHAGGAHLSEGDPLNGVESRPTIKIHLI